MATLKYFNGNTELEYPFGMPNKIFAEMFPGIRGIKYDSFARYAAHIPGSKQVLPVERKIEFKSNPSLHRCDARCLNARGRSCECSCGGKNHGAGSFACSNVGGL